jgi:hypothetical protein
MTVHSKGWIPHFENLWLDVSRLESTIYEEMGQNMFDNMIKETSDVMNPKRKNPYVFYH